MLQASFFIIWLPPIELRYQIPRSQHMQIMNILMIAHDSCKRKQ